MQKSACYNETSNGQIANTQTPYKLLCSLARAYELYSPTCKVKAQQANYLMPVVNEFRNVGKHRLCP